MHGSQENNCRDNYAHKKEGIRCHVTAVLALSVGASFTVLCINVHLLNKFIFLRSPSLRIVFIYLF